MAATQYTFDLSIDFLKDKVALPKEYTRGIFDEPESPSNINGKKQFKNDFGLINIPESLAFAHEVPKPVTILSIDEANIAKERDVEKQKVIRLNQAILKDDTTLFDILLKQNPKLNEYPDNLPLKTAVALGKLDLVKKLVEKGADINVKDNEGRPIIMYVLLNKANQTDILAMLSYLVNEAKADIYSYNNDDTNDVFISSLNSNNFDIAKILLQLGYDINHRHEQKKNYTMLTGYIFYKENRAPIIKFLLENGADMYMKIYHYDAMGYAIRFRNMDAIRLLKENGYKMDTLIDSDDGTANAPLLIFVIYLINQTTNEMEKKELESVFKLLLTPPNPANIFQLDSNGDITMNLAKKFNLPNIVKILTDAVAPPPSTTV